jgi:hypothetical protein
MFGLDPLIFFAFLSWPFIYVVIAIIVYLFMARSDKRDEVWEQAFEKWQEGLPENERIARPLKVEGGEVQ